MYFEKRVRLIAAIGALLAFSSLESMAADPMPASAPGFCHAMTPADTTSWRQRMGPLLGDLHHYCYGLQKMYKAERPGIPKEERDALFVYAIDDFDYVLRARSAQKPHWFLPEVHMKKAFAYTRLGRHAEARAEYERARVEQQRAAMAASGSR